MVAILRLLYFIPALLAIAPGSATLIPGVDAVSLREHHMAQIATNRDLVPPAPSPSPAPPSDTKATLASRQYNPRKRHPKRRFRGRALQSSEPVPSTLLGDFGYGEPLTMNKFYEGSGFTESDNNPTTAGRPISEIRSASTLTRLQALQSCANYSVQQDRYAFQLYFLGSQDIWVCRGYFDAGVPSDSSYFNVANDDVLVAYGYQNSKKVG